MGHMGPSYLRVSKKLMIITNTLCYRCSALCPLDMSFDSKVHCFLF